MLKVLRVKTYDGRSVEREHLCQMFHFLDTPSSFFLIIIKSSRADDLMIHTHEGTQAHKLHAKHNSGTFRLLRRAF